MTVRAVLLGCLLVPLSCYWIVQMEMVWGSYVVSSLSLPANAVFCLFLFLLVNAVLRRWCPRFAFSAGELVVIYLITALGGLLAAHDLGTVLVFMISHAFWFSTPENRWGENLLPHLPSRLVIRDREVLHGLYEGHDTLYTREHLLAWLGPMLWWLIFFVGLILVMICLSALFRRRWVESEKLSFPIVYLPWEMSSSGPILLRNKLMWIGFSISGLLAINNLLHTLFPAVPKFPVVIDITQYLQVRPWNALGWTLITFLPFSVGLVYLIPLDMLFSLWSFYLLWQGQKVISGYFGEESPLRGFPYLRHQAFGAYLGLAAFVIWISRGYLRHAWRGALGLEKVEGEDREPLSYRFAFLGLFLGLGILVAFSRAMGMSYLWILAFFVVFFALSLVVARMRAQIGTPVHDLAWAGPDYMLPELAGARSLAAADLTGLTMFFWFNRWFSPNPMPHQMEGFKLAERAGLPSRHLVWVMLLAAVVGFFSVFWACLHVFYKIGAAAWPTPFDIPLLNGSEPYNRLSVWLSNPTEPNYRGLGAVAVGFVTAALLARLSLTVPGWPLHPVAYAVSGGVMMHTVFAPALLCWTVKSLLLRYGGLRLYRQSIPFALGLILGDVVVNALRTFLGMAFGIYVGFWG